jgi:hypothetical protein
MAACNWHMHSRYYIFSISVRNLKRKAVLYHAFVYVPLIALNKLTYFNENWYIVKSALMFLWQRRGQITELRKTINGGDLKLR